MRSDLKEGRSTTSLSVRQRQQACRNARMRIDLKERRDATTAGVQQRKDEDEPQSVV
jgi:hypothetical protein